MANKAREIVGLYSRKRGGVSWQWQSGTQTQLKGEIDCRYLGYWCSCPADVDSSSTKEKQ